MRYHKTFLLHLQSLILTSIYKKYSARYSRYTNLSGVNVWFAAWGYSLPQAGKSRAMIGHPGVIMGQWGAQWEILICLM
jgi:hypothetical protein